MPVQFRCKGCEHELYSGERIISTLEVFRKFGEYSEKKGIYECPECGKELELPCESDIADAAIVIKRAGYIKKRRRIEKE